MTAILEKLRQLLPKKNQLRFLKKLCLCLLVVVLSCILLFNSGICDAFQAHAFAIATGVAILIIMGLAACGITFLTADQAQDAVNQVWPALSETTQKWLDIEASKVRVYDQIWNGIKCDIVNWTVDAFSDLCNAICKIWGTFASTSTILSFTAENISAFDSGQYFTFPLGAFDDYKHYSLDYRGLKMALYGQFCTAIPKAYSSIVDYFVDVEKNHGIFSSLSFGASGISLLSISYFTNSVHSSPFFSYRPYTGNDDGYYANYGLAQIIMGSPLRFPVSFSAFTQQLYSNGQAAFFGNERLYMDDSTGRIRFYTDTIANIFTDAGVLVGTNYTADKSICPDGLWNSFRDFQDWLAGLTGVSIPGQIDVDSYPGVDTWPGVNTGDGDIDVWPNTDAWPGTIDVTIPQDIADTISIPTEIARDIPDEDTKPTDPTDPNVPPGKPPKVPPLSIPEIIFKKKFPFCLPWDLYNVFTGFLAEPEAPKITIPFKVYDFDFSYTFDFSEYEEFAKISRFFLSVAFILGLIMVSRKMIGSE